MKKLRLNKDLIKKIWISFGAILLFTMTLVFQGLFGPFLYFNQYQMPAFPYALGRYFPFVLSIFGLFVAYHQAGKKFIFALFCSIMMFIIGFILASMNVIFVPLIILFGFIFSFLPFIFFIYASINIRKKYFFPIFSALITFCMFFDIYWFKRGWHYGAQFQGLDFIHHSIVKNIICFFSLYVFIGIYYKSRNIVFLHMALLLFCATISVVAYPWLGELI